MEAAGFEVFDARMIVSPAWEAYYRPMEARLQTLDARAAAEPDLAAAIAEARAEIALWRAAPGEIAYALVLARPA